MSGDQSLNLLSPFDKGGDDASSMLPIIRLPKHIDPTAGYWYTILPLEPS